MSLTADQLDYDKFMQLQNIQPEQDQMMQSADLYLADYVRDKIIYPQEQLFGMIQ